MAGSTRARTQVFLSCSGKDAAFLALLKIHLAMEMRAGQMDVWDETKIAPGTWWQSQIEGALRRAKVAVLLVSPDFLASDCIAQNVLPPLLVTSESGVLKTWKKMPYVSTKRHIFKHSFRYFVYSACRVALKYAEESHSELLIPIGAAVRHVQPARNNSK